MISKLFCRYHLLCDACNWEFKGFAVPGTVSSHSGTRSTRKKTFDEQTSPTPEENSAEQEKLAKKFVEFEERLKKKQSVED